MAVMRFEIAGKIDACSLDEAMDLLQTIIDHDMIDVSKINLENKHEWLGSVVKPRFDMEIVATGKKKGKKMEKKEMK